MTGVIWRAAWLAILCLCEGNVALAQAVPGPVATPVDSSARVAGLESEGRTRSQAVVPGGDHVGFVLAFAGDIDDDGRDDLLVGAYGDDSSAGDAGALFVVAGGSGDTLFAIHGGKQNDNFGAAACPLGDMNGDGRPDFAVGAPGVDGGSAEEAELGCVYYYSGSDGRLLDSIAGSGPGARLGYVLADVGDLDGDGKTDLAAGQRRSGDSARDASAGVLVFRGGSPSRLYEFVAPGAHDAFGSAIAGSGDVDGDGRPDLIIGAYRFNPASLSAGAVFIYSGASGALSAEVDGRSLLGHFGYSITGMGDLDGDGRAEYAVGARFDDEGGGRAGSVSVLSGLDGRVQRQLTGTPGALFGSSVASAGDLDGDGRHELCVGAPRGGDGETGEAYVFSGADGRLLSILSGEEAGDHFGIRVAGGGDADGDGLPDILVGAVGNDEGGVDAGKAYVFSGKDFSLVQVFIGTSRVTAQDTARVARVMEAERALKVAADTVTLPDVVYDSAQVDVMPILRRSVSAEYPPTAVGSGLSGWVQVRVLVLSDGAPGRVDIVDDAGLGPDFRLAALNAARQWFFLPATKSGQPVPAWAVFPIGFAPEEARRGSPADSGIAAGTASADSAQQALVSPSPAPSPVAVDTALGAPDTASEVAPVPELAGEVAEAPAAASGADTSGDAEAEAAGADPTTQARSGSDTASAPAEAPADTATGTQVPEVEVDPSRIYEVTDLDLNPELQAKVDPQYPAAARLAGDTSTVIVAATVDTLGGVTRADVISCTVPGKGFEESAKAAVRRWRFDPGLRGGRKVAYRVEYPIEFRLE